MRLLLTPFFLCMLLGVISRLAVQSGNEKLSNITIKLFISLFLICWFGFIIVWSILHIKQGGKISTLIFITPFIIAGIFLVYKFFKEKE